MEEHREVLKTCAQAVWDADAETLFTTLEAVPSDQLDDLMRHCDLAFATAAIEILGQETTVDRTVFVARELDSGATRVINPIPYLFEVLLRRQYGEPEIANGVPMEQMILHSIVGAALLRPNQLDRLLADANLPENT